MSTTSGAQLPNNFKMQDVTNWNCDEVGSWLKLNGLGDYVSLLCDQHKIDGVALLSLTEDDLKHPPLHISVLGHLKKLSLKLNLLKQENVQANIKRYHSIITIDKPKSTRSSYKKKGPLRPDESEITRFIWSVLYVVVVIVLSGFAVVISDNRVPDFHKFPPLPDLILDNLTYVPWAFKASEIIINVLSLCGVALIFFHKYRLIIAKRVCYLWATLFLLRTFTILLTSLTVPGVHLYQNCKRYNTIPAIFQQAFTITTGLGMHGNGVKTCGDLMFSGHTVSLTLCNLFLIEYTSRTRFHYFHIITWLLNLSGMFFILAGHEHYSIDVFIAFYLTCRLFMYYHTLANNRTLIQRHARIWFPFFTFFESNCDGAVPNEFEWPLPSWTKVKCYIVKLKNKIKFVN